MPPSLMIHATTQPRARTRPGFVREDADRTARLRVAIFLAALTLGLGIWMALVKKSSGERASLALPVFLGVHIELQRRLGS